MFKKSYYCFKCEYNIVRANGQSLISLRPCNPSLICYCVQTSLQLCNLAISSHVRLEG